MAANTQKRVLFTACLIALISSGGMALAQSTTSGSSTTTGATASSNQARDAIKHINLSTDVIHKMEADSHMKQLLQQAKGVLVVPEYGQAALGVGARGGTGVLFVKRGSTWGDPAFYNIGGVSAGVQAGIQGGAIAMVLNNQKALDSFKQDNNFSLNADAGLTVVNWAKEAQGSAGKGDVTVWADTKGLFGGLTVSVTDINFDESQTGAFYGQKIASAKDVVEGRLKAPRSPELQRAVAALSGASSSTATGGSAAGGTSESGGAKGNK